SFEEMLHMEPSLEQRIRERAYEIWNATGRGDGRADEHWLSAERELLATPRVQPAAPKMDVRPKIATSNTSQGEPPACDADSLIVSNGNLASSSSAPHVPNLAILAPRETSWPCVRAAAWRTTMNLRNGCRISPSRSGTGSAPPSRQPVRDRNLLIGLYIGKQ